MVGEQLGSERERLSGLYRELLDEASARWSGQNPGNRAILDERIETSRALLRRWVWPARPVVLDLGCGEVTHIVPELDEAPDGDLVRVGADLLLERLQKAAAMGRRRNGLLCADGARLPLRSASVDLVAVFTVLSSVGDDGLRRRIGGEVARVLRPGGGALVYEFRVRSPRNRFLEPLPPARIETYFPGFSAEWRRLTLAPPLARRLGGGTPRLYPLLARIPFLRTHSLGLLIKPA